MSPTPEMKAAREFWPAFYGIAAPIGAYFAGWHWSFKALAGLILLDLFAAWASRKYNRIPYDEQKVVQGIIRKALYVAGLFSLYLIGPLMQLKELHIMAAGYFCFLEAQSAWRHMGECEFKVGWITDKLKRATREVEKEH